MNIVFPPQFRNQYVLQLGMRANHVEDAIRKKDHSEFLRVDASQLAIFSRKLKLVGREFCLVAGGLQTRDALRVDFAYRVLPDYYQDGDKTPLALLRKLSNDIGISMTVGGVTSKFILGQQIACQTLDPAKAVSLQNPGNLEVITQRYLRIIPGSPPVADCALCFCINAGAYRNMVGLFRK